MISRTSGTIPFLHIAVFVVLALALCFLPPFANESVPLMSVVPPYSPLLAALVVRTLVAREGFADAHLGVRHVQSRYWLFAIFLPLSWNGAAAALDVIAGAHAVHPSAIVSGIPRWLLRLPLVAIFLVGEELGWRSYLIEKLRPASRNVAFTICGLVWFSWHSQVWFGPAEPLHSRATLFMAVMCFSFIFGWLYYASDSVWPCLIMHVFNNAADPAWFKGGWTSVADKPLLSDASNLFPLLFTVLVLSRSGCFRNRASVRPAPPGGPA